MQPQITSLSQTALQSIQGHMRKNVFPGPKTQTESGGFLTDSYQEECSPECCLRPLISPDLTDSEVNQSHLELAILPQHFLQ